MEKKAKRFLVANRKGGVLKTSIAVHLADNQARAGKKVLLIDTDSQGNCASRLGFETWDGFGMALITGGDYPDEKIIKEVRPNLFLMAGGDKTAAGKSVLAGAAVTGESSEGYVEKAFSKYDKDYDLIIMDAGPSWDVMNVSLMFWADRVIVPTSTEPDSIEGVVRVAALVPAVKKHNPEFGIAKIVPTRFDSRKTSANEFAAALRRSFGNLVSDTVIRLNEGFVRAQREDKTIYEWSDPKGVQHKKGREDFDSLAKEIF